MHRGLIFDISEMTLHDGPGLRTTVFFKGCPLRCLWCHNPEGLSFQPQLMARQIGCTGCNRCRAGCSHLECQPYGRCLRACPKGLLSIAGQTVDAAELAAKLKRQGEILILNGGGITLSGGEPLAQPQFLLELLAALKPLHTVVETSGHAPAAVFQAMAGLCDLIYLDIKHTDPAEHRRLTGIDPVLIQANLAWLKASGRPFVVRATLIPGLNDSPANLERLAGLLEGAAALEQVELLPVNPLTRAKYGPAGMTCALPEQTEKDAQPDAAARAALIALFAGHGLKATIL